MLQVLCMRSVIRTRCLLSIQEVSGIVLCTALALLVVDIVIPQNVYADQSPTPTPVPLSISVIGFADATKLDVDADLHIYLTVRNLGLSQISDLKVELILPTGFKVPVVSTPWPSQLGPRQSVTREYITKALKEGNYNIGAIVYYDGEASEGHTFSLGSVSVANARIIPPALPESLVGALVGVIGALLGIFMGFVLPLVRDFFRDRIAQQGILTSSYAQMWAWLKEARDSLERTDIPGSVINEWNTWPAKDPTAFRVLERSDPVLLEEVESLFKRISGAKETELKSLVLEIDGLSTRVRAQLRKR